MHPLWARILIMCYILFDDVADGPKYIIFQCSGYQSKINVQFFVSELT